MEYHFAKKLTMQIDTKIKIINIILLISRILLAYSADMRVRAKKVYDDAIDKIGTWS